MQHKLATTLGLALMLLLTFCIIVPKAAARQAGKDSVGNPEVAATDPKATEHKSATGKEGELPTASLSVQDRLKALEQIVEHQQQEIQALRALIEKKDTQVASERPATMAPAQAVQPQMSSAAYQSQATGKNEASPPEAQKKIDELYKKFGAIRFSGDLRFRVETFRNQGFDALEKTPDRNRMRLRARLALDGTINKHFDWGMRLATGAFTNPVSSNQTFTDFFERKPFALDRAFIRYDSKSDKVGVQLIAGKFEPTFRRTQLVWDDDINVEGTSEALYFKTKSPLRQIKLVAFQLPFSEVPIGKDGIVYGGQLQADWQASTKLSGNVNIGYYEWNQADQVLLGLGASATQVNGGIFNGSTITGGQNSVLGTTNRIIRNAAGQPTGFLAGFNLVDVLSTLTWQATGRLPLTFTLDYVHNATGRVRDEKDGYWVGGQVGQVKEKGDWLFGYFYTRIQQDAVLVPFNFDDILGSNSRVHMPTFAYQVANNVTVQWTGLFSQRVRQVVVNSPVNRYLNRLQFDVVYKF